MGSQWCLLVLQVLNEVVIDRGPSSYLCNLDLYIEGHLVTSVLGDGEEQTFFKFANTHTLSLSLYFPEHIKNIFFSSKNAS